MRLQAKLIIPVGSKPQEINLLMNIGSNEDGKCNFGKHWCLVGHWLRQSLCDCQNLGFQMQTISRWTYKEVQGKFLCIRWSTTQRKCFLSDICTSCLVNNDKILVHSGDSAWIEEQARWCYQHFSSTDLEPGKIVYDEMPLRFTQYLKNGTHKVLKLKKTLYRLWQSPQVFWKYITENLKTCGLEESKLIHVYLLEARLSVLCTLTALSSGAKT